MFKLVRKSLAQVHFRSITTLKKSGFQFSTFRDSCKSVLTETDSLRKSQQIQELYKNVQSNHFSNFSAPEDNTECWKTLDFGFSDEIKFAEVREINNFCKERKYPVNISVLHGICHIEFNAMSMYMDTIGRFMDVAVDEPEFIRDFLEVAYEEAGHFQMLRDRLIELKTPYGTIPVHNTLYENSEKTKDDLLSRIFVTSLVHEARGMDSGPRLLVKLKSMSDKPSVKIMEKILHDEEKHVAYGIKWFKRFAEKGGYDPRDKFRELAQSLNVKIFPPFNKEARDRANFEESWYLDL